MKRKPSVKTSADAAAKDRSPSPAPGPLQEAVAKRRGAKRVSFSPMVSVVEYKRVLGGGGGVPTDGSWVTLGLGERARTLTQPLVAPRGRKASMDEEAQCAYKPGPERAQLLKSAMGAAAYGRAWKAHKLEMARLSQQRRLANADAADVALMPSSLKEARQRALRVSADLAGQRPGCSARAKSAAGPLGQVGPAGAGKKAAKPGKRGRPAKAKASPAGATAAQEATALAPSSPPRKARKRKRASKGLRLKA